MRHPDKHPEVIVQDQQPFNSESLLEALGRGFQSWIGADLAESAGHSWTWRFWEAALELDLGEHRVVARALDSAVDTQPESAGSIWNFKSYANNAWHRVSVNAQ